MQLRLLALTGLVAVTAVAPGRVVGREVSGRITVTVSRTSADVVVSLVPKVGAPRVAAPGIPVVIDQRGKEFIPHVLPIVRGTKVAFRNSDEFLHNIHAYQRRKEAFNVAMPPVKAFTWDRIFQDVGTVTLLCDVHPEMSAHIVVLETPWFAKTAKDGTFVIRNVPPGEYTLRTWHEKAKGKAISVRVLDAKGTSVSLELGA